ncbi:MAG: hypothetical protein OXU70_06305 [Gammaproteobacteria bacterium]|nr:hypothetical protein [Gammaproteobacteria bacterium]
MSETIKHGKVATDARMVLDLRLEDGRLRFFNPKRGEYLLTPEEQHQVNQEQRRALEAAEARIRELERQRRPEH